VGALFYGSTEPITIDDRTLAHLKVLIASRLRRGESFTVSWRHPADQAEGRTAIWLDSSIPLRFEFADPVMPELNKEWLEQLASSVSLSGGIELLPEAINTSSTSGSV